MGCGGKGDNLAFGGIKSNERGACSTPADGTMVDKEYIAQARLAIGLDIGEAGVGIAIDLTGMVWCLAVLSTPTKGDLFAPLEVAEDFLAEL